MMQTALGSRDKIMTASSSEGWLGAMIIAGPALSASSAVRSKRHTHEFQQTQVNPKHDGNQLSPGSLAQRPWQNHPQEKRQQRGHETHHAKQQKAQVHPDSFRQGPAGLEHDLFVHDHMRLVFHPSGVLSEFFPVMVLLPSRGRFQFGDKPLASVCAGLSWENLNERMRCC